MARDLSRSAGEQTAADGGRRASRLALIVLLALAVIVVAFAVVQAATNSRLPEVQPAYAEVKGRPLPEQQPAAPEDNAASSAAALMPMIGPDASKNWRVFARPFDAPRTQPLVSLVVAELGLSRPLTLRVIDRLPPDVSLGFSHTAAELSGLLDRARQSGKEYLLVLPAEPDGYPLNDPGPEGLLIQLDSESNRQRLDRVLSRAAGYVGLIDTRGSRFMATKNAVEPIMGQLALRGLLLASGNGGPSEAAQQAATGLRLPYASADQRITPDSGPKAMETMLTAIEAKAKEGGEAFVIAVQPNQAQLDQLVAWASSLEERTGIRLAPISALIARRRSL